MCDDHGVVRSGLRRILDAEDDVQVVGESASRMEAVAVARAERPDVFVVDIGLPDGSGITATAEVRKVSPTTRVLVLQSRAELVHFARETGPSR